MSKKILILTHEFPPFHGGIATYCAEMAAAATAIGHQVTVLAPDYQADNSIEDGKRPYHVLRFKGDMYRTLNMPRVLWETFKIDPSQYDIVHAAEWSFAVASHVVYPFKKFPFLTTLHGTDIFGFETSKVVRLLNARRALEHAQMVTANSHFTASLASEYHPYYPAERIVPTHLGIAPYWFSQAGDTEAVRKKYNVPESRKIILSVARLDPRKGHACVLQALEQLTQAEKDQLAYVIVGGADNKEHEKYLRTLAARCGVPAIFVGKISNDDVRTFYKASWVFCLPGQKDPKKIEGFGLVYLEAAAQELPSVATAIGGVPEVIRDGETGWLLSNDRPQTLANTFSELLQQPERVKAFGKAAKEWAENFSWHRCARQTYGSGLLEGFQANTRSS